jgi:hypothetical protein
MVRLAVVLALVGCGAAAKETRVPDGRQGYVITCESPSSCLAKAGETCSMGYDVIREGTADSMETWWGKEHTMLIACK